MLRESSAHYGKKDQKKRNEQKQIRQFLLEILNRCRVLKEEWRNAQSNAFESTRPISKKNKYSFSLPALAGHNSTQADQFRWRGGPHFLIACEDVAETGTLRTTQAFPFARLDSAHTREREVAQLACEGRSNKEIAQNACLSLQTVKKHLHSVFRKLASPQPQPARRAHSVKHQ